MNTWGFAPDDPNPYLAKTQAVFIEAETEIKNAWPLIVSYSGTYGSGAYDYGVSPPMSQDGQTIVWESSEIIGKNPWTLEKGKYTIYFHTK
jgi:hypothetical protein